MTRIIAYTYEADYHCIGCTQKRFAPPGTELKRDECGVPFLAHDGDKNPVHPVFDTDELPTDLSAHDGGWPAIACGTCQTVIHERTKDA